MSILDKAMGYFLRPAEGLAKHAPVDARAAEEAIPTSPLKLHDGYKYESVPGHPKNPWKTKNSPTAHVRYLDEGEREQYRLTVGHDGRLYDHKGMRFDTLSSPKRYGNKALYVMDKKGNIYASNYREPGRFHHSSFLAGGEVSGAGELKVINGSIMEIDRQSGHYAPTKEHLADVVGNLRSQGAVFGDHHVTWDV